MLTIIDFKKCLNKQNYVWGCCLVEIIDSNNPSGYHIYKTFKLPKSKLIKANFCVYTWQYVYTSNDSTYQLPYRKEIRFDNDSFSNNWVFKTKEECEKYTRKLNNKELRRHKYIKTFEPVDLIKPAYEERPVNYHKIQFNYGDIVKFIRYMNDKGRYEYKIGFIVELCWYNGGIGIFDGNSMANYGYFRSIILCGEENTKLSFLIGIDS